MIILSKILINVIQAVYSDGKVSSHVFKDADVQIIIEDNGTGISVEIQSRFV